MMRDLMIELPCSLACPLWVDMIYTGVVDQSTRFARTRTSCLRSKCRRSCELEEED